MSHSGGRGNYGDRDRDRDRGDRNGHGDRGDRNGHGDRGDRGGHGDRGDMRGGHGDRDRDRGERHGNGYGDHQNRGGQRGQQAGRARPDPGYGRDYPPMPTPPRRSPPSGEDMETRVSPKRPRGDAAGGSGDDGSERGSERGEGSSRGRAGDRGEGSSRGRGEDRGGGGDRGRGGRAGRGGRRVVTQEERRQERLERHDLVISRPETVPGQIMSKQGNTGKQVALQANFFGMEKRTDWCIYNYRVDFVPDELETKEKKKLVRPHEPTLGAYIFDGSTLYVSHRISPDPLVLCSLRESDKTPIEISIRLVAELSPTDVMYLQFYNIIVRKCLEAMQLEELGRNFYDRHQAIRIEAHRLELWPGYKTTMRNHECGVLLGVEITHKVLRTDNCLHVMARLRGSADMRNSIKNELVGAIVMTHYNRKTYRVDDIDWDKSPESTFDLKGTQTSFADYFKERYNLRVTDRKQPMLVSRPKKKDFHRGMTGPILLVPEFCQMTGLTDEMRGNFQLMKALTGYLHVGPDKRVDSVRGFMSRLKNAPGIGEELNRWGLKFKDRLIEFTGRVVDREKIMFGEGRFEITSDKADWNMAFRSQQMTSSVPLLNWVVIVPAREAQAVDTVVHSMQKVADPIKFRISRPTEIIRIPDIRIPTYLSAIAQAMTNHKGKIQLIFIVLPKQVTDIYAAVKKQCCVEFGIPSQCFVAKNAHNPRGLMSICTKVVIQVNAKLGGEPWFVQIPLKKLMIVGFDVYHCGKRKNNSVGAMVSTTHETQARYYSTVSFHTSKEELSSNLCTDFTKCLYAFQKVNKDLPERIIMYRDGVGEGQLTFVYDTELKQIQAAYKKVYESAGKNPPKFTFIVVTKRTNTRIFQNNRGRVDNPEAGTIVDDVITLPERYDFYMISQCARQGTVSPTSYNVLYDTQGLSPDKIQRLTFKLCHMYFNWSGTVTVPAPCQYAHKLAYLTGVALQGAESSEALSHLLHFL